MSAYKTKTHAASRAACQDGAERHVHEPQGTSIIIRDDDVNDDGDDDGAEPHILAVTLSGTAAAGGVVDSSEMLMLQLDFHCYQVTHHASCLTLIQCRFKAFELA